MLIEADRIASGASGRNGGQIHSGLRRDVIWLEEHFGLKRAREFWSMSEEAKALLRGLIVRFAISCDLRAGVIETQHKASFMPDAAELVRVLRERFGYDQVRLLDRDETVAALGSERFFGAVHRQRWRASRPLPVLARPGACARRCSARRSMSARRRSS